jgi:2-hydroxychromene-2-carboxylate isomerase
VDYYLSPSSPWSYLRHARLAGIARRQGATVNVKPMELVGTLFPQTGAAGPQEGESKIVERCTYPLTGRALREPHLHRSCRDRRESRWP